MTKDLFIGMLEMRSKYFKWQTLGLRGRAEITKQFVLSGEKCNLLLVMILGKKTKCLAKQFPSSRPAGWRGKPVGQSGRTELQLGSWHLQAAKLRGFPSPCPSPCSLPTYTNSCSLPGRPWWQPVSKNVRNAALWCCGRHRNTCCLQEIALNIIWCNKEQKCGTTKGTERDLLPFPFTAGKVAGYLQWHFYWGDSRNLRA